ncbi:MAG: AAA family ATPase [Byssovorax sp.]
MTEPSPERPAVSRPRRWLERLKINRFRSIEPGTELCFSEGLHVLLGKNATGKSTLLDLIAAAIDLNFDRQTFHEEPIDLEFVLRAGAYRVEAAVKREAQLARPRFGARKAEVSEQTIHEEGRYTFRADSGFEVTVNLSTEELPQRAVKGVDPAEIGLDEQLGWRHQRPPLAPRIWGLRDTWFQGSLYKYPALGTLLGEGAFSFGTHDQILQRAPESDELLDAIEGGGSEICLGDSYCSYPGWLPKKIFDDLPRDGSNIDVPLAAEPLLSFFIREMGFSEARMFLGPPRTEQRVGHESFVYSSPAFAFYRDGRLARRADQLSYGQRRLFALGWYLMCNLDVAILDEPANGLHESWIAFLVSQLQDRQVFLTSQNREVLDMLPFSTEMELRRGFILCESRKNPDGVEPALSWRGLRDDESSLMIKALHASRIDLVTDLLRALNLW